MTSRKKVLLAEDDDFTCFMMAELFQEVGCEYMIAKNGQDCSDILHAHPSDFGVVLMDIHMPGLSGVDAAAMIRGAPVEPLRTLPIFALTADSGFHDAAVMERLQMNGYLKKPILLADVRRIIDTYCPSA